MHCSIRSFEKLITIAHTISCGYLPGGREAGWGTVGRPTLTSGGVDGLTGDRRSVWFDFRQAILYSAGRVCGWRNWQRNIYRAQVIAHLILDADA